MPKTDIEDYDSTAANNTDIDSIDIGEGSTAISDFNNALRELMAHSKQYLATRASDVPSAATLDLTTAIGSLVDITGTTTVTAVTLADGAQRIARAAGNFKLTAGANLVVNDSVVKSYTTKSGDILVFEGYASSVVRVWVIQTAAINMNSTAISNITELNEGPLGGLRNKLINGAGAINQRVATTVSNDNYGHDQHYALTQSNDITVSTVTAPATGIGTMMRLTQSNASAQRMGYAQIIESADTYGMRGLKFTLGGKLNYSNAAAVRYAILEWEGTADAVTSDVVNDWTSSTYTTGNFFKSTSLRVREVGSLTPSAATITDFALTGTIAATANNVIVFIWTEGTAAQNSTLDLRWYCVEGDATEEDDAFSPRPKPLELSLCQRHYWKSYSQSLAPGAIDSAGTLFNGNAASNNYPSFGKVVFPTPMWKSPTVTLYDNLDGSSGYGRADSTQVPAITNNIGDSGFGASVNNTAVGANVFLRVHAVAKAEL
ncbi:hypothetical protein JY97_14830 [Alkalispirochaeta odontotermitis]|nr:hypothetical protein JY97_14830 [Alkalispirochaeta odontotermitis]